MRLIRVTAPKGHGAQVARLALECGISDATIHPVEQHTAGKEPTAKDAVDMHVSTPAGRALIEALVRAPFYDRAHYSIDVREPRAILKSTSAREITRPVTAPMVDIDQELWQFSHITYSFVLRVLIAAALLAYGMIKENWLLMVGGLAFLPLMPLMLGIGFGALDRQWKLLAQSLIAFAFGTALIIGSAAMVAGMAEPPMMFDKFPPLVAGVLVSLVIGVAGALATADDAGHRQLVGLAAASQLALVPVWLGISLVFGFDESVSEKLTSFGLNAAMMLLGAAAVFGALQLRANAAHDPVTAGRQYKH
jgi:hypothetical protein